MNDQTSVDRLNKLHPKLRAIALAAYTEAVQATPVGVHPFITDTFRSIKRSNELYAQGRTAPGPVVSNAKGGSSYHNYGLAIDFVNQINGKEIWKVDKNWMTVVAIFKKHGFKWGGDFKSIPDAPHFEYTFGHHWRDLLALYNEGKVDAGGYVLI